VAYGHVNVPQQYPELGNWVHCQRKNHSLLKRGVKSNLTVEKIEKLKSIGFVFFTRKSPLEPRWDDSSKKKKKSSRPKKVKVEEGSRSSSEEEDDEDSNGHYFYQQNQNPTQYAQNQIGFAP
jgi:hypothetical protein